MNPNACLILHKVRGELEFDIGEPVVFADEEEGWIISTSGHRAYPIWAEPITKFVNIHDDTVIWPKSINPAHDVTTTSIPGWRDLPDHFQPRPLPEGKRTTASELLKQLGLGPKPIPRRSI